MFVPKCFSIIIMTDLVLVTLRNVDIPNSNYCQTFSRIETSNLRIKFLDIIHISLEFYTDNR